MTDDDIILLWTLDGSWGWKDLIQFFRMSEEKWYYHAHPQNLNQTIYFSWRENHGRIDFYTPPRLVEGIETLYIIKDPITFVPSERWLKLLIAKCWSEQNKDRFH